MLALSAATLTVGLPAALADTGTPASTSSLTALPFSFLQTDFAALDVVAAWRPWAWESARSLPRDVIVTFGETIDGVLYNHPVNQAHTGLRSLDSYRLTGNEVYLEHAEVYADHLISYHTESNGAWFYAYPFAWQTLQPPWYSAMAQGMALALFTRLYEATGDATYKQAADLTFASFLATPNKTRPWVISIDRGGYLRLEEYPTTAWQFVLNGHISAAFGLYDYYRVTGDTGALALYRGALTSVAHYAATFRCPGWISAYSLGVPSRFAGYHLAVTRQLLELYTLSGSDRFAQIADQFAADYPDPNLSGTIRVGAGKLTAYRFAANGTVIAKRSLVLEHAVTMAISRRARVCGQAGYWFSVTNGTLSGYCLLEVPAHRYYAGQIATLLYRPARRAKIKAGTITGYHYDAHGRVTGKLSKTFTKVAAATMSKRATINGVSRALIDSGALAGYWVNDRALVSPALLADALVGPQS